MAYDTPNMEINMNTSMKEIMMVVHPLSTCLPIYAYKMKLPLENHEEFFIDAAAIGSDAATKKSIGYLEMSYE